MKLRIQICKNNFCISEANVTKVNKDVSTLSNGIILVILLLTLNMFNILIITFYMVLSLPLRVTQKKLCYWQCFFFFSFLSVFLHGWQKFFTYVTSTGLVSLDTLKKGCVRNALLVVICDTCGS